MFEFFPEGFPIKKTEPSLKITSKDSVKSALKVRRVKKMVQNRDSFIIGRALGCVWASVLPKRNLPIDKVL